MPSKHGGMSGWRPCDPRRWDLAVLVLLMCLAVGTIANLLAVIFTGAYCPECPEVQP